MLGPGSRSSYPNRSFPPWHYPYYCRHRRRRLRSLRPSPATRRAASGPSPTTLFQRLPFFQCLSYPRHDQWGPSQLRPSIRGQQAQRSPGPCWHRYSGHSFRCGAATRVRQAGIPDDDIQLLGLSKSNAYKCPMPTNAISRFTQKTSTAYHCAYKPSPLETANPVLSVLGRLLPPPPVGGMGLGQAGQGSLPRSPPPARPPMRPPCHGPGPARLPACGINWGRGKGNGMRKKRKQEDRRVRKNRGAWEEGRRKEVVWSNALALIFRHPAIRQNGRPLFGPQNSPLATTNHQPDPFEQNMSGV